LALRFSIITPTFNRRDMLAEALDSVARQEWPEIEHIVVDGGSTDGTLELVAGHPEIRLIGGPDEGVYDALNKGIAAATGDVVALLNSDDALEPGALKAVAAGFAEDPGCESVCGSARLVAGDKTIEIYDRDHDKRLTSARTALLGASIINARFFRKASLDRLGPFSLAYRIVSDRDFLMRAITLGLRTKPIAPLVYTYRRHHASLSFSGEAAQRPAIWRELLAVARYWADAETIAPSDRRVARVLEGRCLGRLIQRDVAEGRARDAWHLLARSGRGLPQNLTALAEGVIDAAAVKIAR
jgi:glycosyltransferase involved in cell wall biosynthesis